MTKQKPYSSQLMLEPLESRVMLSVTVTQVGSTLSIVGDTTNNFVDVTYSNGNDTISVTADGVVHEFLNSAINRIQFEGNDGDDRLTSDVSERVVAYGGDGDDTLYGSNSSDYLAGGDGNDKLFGLGGADRLEGDLGDDTIHGGPGDDRLFGYIGNDTIVTGLGDDYTIAGSGNDNIVNAGGADFIEAGSGNDRITGGPDFDQIRGNYGDDVINGGGGNDFILASFGDDRVVGGEGNDSIFAGQGNDFVSAGAGNDFVEGGAGSDDIRGGDGDDELFSLTQDVSVMNTESDSVVGNAGLDVVDGEFEFVGVEFDAQTGLLRIQGDDNDNFSRLVEFPDGTIRVEFDSEPYLFFQSGEIIEVAFKGGDGNDTFLNNTHINSTIEGFGGDDQLYGGFAVDIINGGQGNDRLFGRAGNDYLGDVFLASYRETDRVFQPNMRTPLYYEDVGNDEMFGGDDDDVIKGSMGNDRVVAGFGNDQIEGGSGNDLLETEGAIDRARGDDGDDTYQLHGGYVYDTSGYTTIYGSELRETFSGDLSDGGEVYMRGGDDTFSIFDYGSREGIGFNAYLGAGNDRVYISRSRFGYTGQVDINIYGEGGDDYFNISALYSRPTIHGGTGNDNFEIESRNYWTNIGAIIYAGSGDDTVQGSIYADEIYGEGGSDVIHGDGGDDYIDGGFGNDMIFGEDGDDTLLGNGGDDHIVGGAGTDIIDGGPGNDNENQ